MIGVYSPKGALVYEVSAEEARDMIRSGQARKKTSLVDGRAREDLEITARVELPTWIGGTKYHFVEDVAPGVKVHALRPSGCRVPAPMPVVMEIRERGRKRPAVDVQVLRAA